MFVLFLVRLTFTAAIAHVIRDHCKCQIPCRCTAQAMAQNVFTKQKLYPEAVVCLLRQGRVRAGLAVARLRCTFSREDYKEILRTCPSIQLLHALVDREQVECPLSIGCVLLTLLEDNKFDLVLPFIQELQNMPSKGTNHKIIQFKHTDSQISCQNVKFNVL